MYKNRQGGNKAAEQKDYNMTHTIRFTRTANTAFKTTREHTNLKDYLVETFGKTKFQFESNEERKAFIESNLVFKNNIAKFSLFSCTTREINFQDNPITKVQFELYLKEDDSHYAHQTGVLILRKGTKNSYAVKMDIGSESKYGEAAIDLRKFKKGKTWLDINSRLWTLDI